MELKIDWEKSVRGIGENVDAMDRFNPNIGPYYLTYYICPTCQRTLLYKIKTRGAYTYFKGQRVSVYNVFTCPHCRRMLASPVNASGVGKLSELAIVSKEYRSDDEYIAVLNEGIRHMNDD